MPDTLKRPFEWSNLMPFTYYWRSIKMIAKQGLLIGGASSAGGSQGYRSFGARSGSLSRVLCVTAVCICYFITAFTQGGIGSIQTNQLLFGPLEYTQQFILIPGAPCIRAMQR